MSGSGEIGVGVVGIGFMGKTHIKAWQRAQAAGQPCRLVAVSDQDADRRRGRVGAVGNLEGGAGEGPLFDPDEVAGYEDPADLFADDSVAVVSLCTPTPTHVDLAIAAIEAGKHVLVEKPVALTSAEVERLAAAAAGSDRICMPAMCMRFWPAWAWLEARVRDGEFGAVRSATFHRLGSLPSWSRGFYADDSLSGGALVDLHIHDTDFVRFCFGDPESVASAGSANHLTTLYRFRQGPSHVVAEGGWGHDPSFPFTMRFVVSFEDATVDFDLAREPQLRLSRGGASEPVSTGDGDGYDGEVRHLLAAICSEVPAPAVTLEDAACVMRILEAERRSLEAGGPVAL